MTFSNKDFQPAGSFANASGMKALIYGPPGSAKTPLLNTASRPILLATEAGLLSMKGSNIPTCYASTPAAIDDFFKWLFHSNEPKNFDTVGIDSISHMCEVYLVSILNGTSKAGNKVHGQAAYGEMAKNVMDHMRPLYHLPNKHVYGIAKQEAITLSGISTLRPFFPGKYLPVELPHLFDAILRLAIHNVPGMGATLAFRCQQSIDEIARNRTGNLAEFEPPNFGALVQKAMT